MQWIVIVVVLLGFGLGYMLYPERATAPDPGANKSEVGVTPSTPAPAIATGQPVEIYDGITAHTGDRTLDLSGRGLSGSLKAEVRLLSNLEVLNLSNNQFTGLPAEVGQLSRLRVLDLSGNPLTGLPYELGNLQQLETFDLRGTDYAAADLEIIRAQLPVSVDILSD